jgi:hypothetical protein
MAQPPHSRVDIHRTVANLFEQRTELLLIHEARISDRAFWFR